MAYLAAPAFAADHEADESYYLDDQPVVASSRFARPASRIAENVTVITSEEIERLNAHTLADVLQTVPGIQLDYLRTPSTFSYFNIQGADNTTVLVLIDGLRQNDFNQNMAEPGLIRVQQIERIEIIKGAASSAWGPALGGVINIVTKTPETERPAAGMVSGSIGDKFTADSRAELSGTLDRLGYYLTAGNLHSDGLLPNNGTNLNSLYAKLVYALPGKGVLTGGFSYLDAERGMDEGLLGGSWKVHDNNRNSRNYGFLELSQPLGDRLHMELHGYLTSQRGRTDLNDVIQEQIVPWSHAEVRDNTRGLDGRLVWGDSRQNLVVGGEYVNVQSRHLELAQPIPPYYDKQWDRWALYGNGSFALGPLTVLPGVRVDHTGVSGDYLSYTVGATLNLTDKSLLRAYGAQGYGLPNPRYLHGLMRITTLQGGVETGDIPYLWLKGTYFFNRLRDIESMSEVVLHNQSRQGVELEAKTVPLLGFSLSGGYTFSYVKDLDSGERVKSGSQWSVPPHLLKLALNYDNVGYGLRGTLTGNYLNWNAAPGTMAADGAMIWDLHLNWKILPQHELSPELFFSARNLFDGIQTLDTELYNNTPRWFEGGVRFKF